MYTYELKGIVFNGVMRPRRKSQVLQGVSELMLCRKPERPMQYSILSQNSDDLRDQENSPSVSMWPYLLASEQTQRLNEISIYTEKGTTSDKMRFRYLNDFALSIWTEMHKNTRVMGRLHRPPRGAALSFGMPFSD